MLASRDFKNEKTTFEVRGVEIGGEKIVIISGPCAVEGRESYLQTAEAVKQGALIFWRRSLQTPCFPYSFQGLEEEAKNFRKKQE